MNRIIFFLFVLGFYILIDYYVFQVVKVVVKNSIPNYKKIIYLLYWLLTAFTFFSLMVFNMLDGEKYFTLRSILITAFFINLTSKITASFFVVADDIRRFVIWAYNRIMNNGKSVPIGQNSISRSDFLSKSALIVGAIPIGVFSFGIISSAYDYRIRKKIIYLPDLPKSFDGIRIAQLSDIHSGSLYNKTAVKGGIDMLLAEKPDVLFFTGDLINNQSNELKEYQSIFSKAQAPLGVYSILGNHDYGDYKSWASPQAKQQDFKNLIQSHKDMGWDILLDENRYLVISGERIGIIGVQNWGVGRFPKYGNLSKAYGKIEADIKILLSHDPSHWDAQVRPQHSDINLTLSGHTHGFQFGVEIGNFRWSPSQWMYKQWADLYQENNQYLYVNRGFGFLGYPGRVGILPEITILELKRG